jgi:beta-phosphoglucomutase-like phosphatase (HAD superfamily)
MKKYILFDHDGVLVDTEFWYYKAGERALADIGFTLDKDQYLRDMTQSLNHFQYLGSSLVVKTRTIISINE